MGRSLMAVLAVSTPAELRQQLRYLKAENEALRAQLKGPVRVTPSQRATLVKFARPLGKSIRQVATIVKPETILRWIRAADKAERDARKRPKKKMGRPATPFMVEQIILRIARETGWGYTRIKGELRQLGLEVSRSTVVNILKKAGLPTGPERGESTWDQFVKAHAQTLWACDFFSQKVVTATGLVPAFVLVFINLVPRRVWASPATTTPTEDWAAVQAREFVQVAERQGPAPKMVVRDRDTKFGPLFDRVLRARGVRPMKLPHCSPNLNAHAERFVQTVRVECLDRFIVLGTRHLDYLVGEFMEHYNTERPHSGIGHRTPAGTGPPGEGRVVCRKRLGGVLRSYGRVA